MLRGTLRGRIASFWWLKSTYLLHHLGPVDERNSHQLIWISYNKSYIIYINHIYIIYVYIHNMCIYVCNIPFDTFNMVFTHQERCTNSSSNITVINLGEWPQVADCFLRQNSGGNCHPTLCQYTMKGRFRYFPHGFTGENICHVGRLEFSSFSCLSTMYVLRMGTESYRLFNLNIRHTTMDTIEF